MKKIKRVLAIVFAVVFLLMAGYIGLTIWSNKQTRVADAQPVISTDWLEKQVASISEYTVLEYRYTNVSKFEDQLDFYGWKLPLTTKSFIITYDGDMKLGIDGSKVQVQQSGDTLRILLPPPEVLSHVIYEDSVEVFDQTKNIFNPIQVEDYTTFATEEKAAMEQKARLDGIFEEAKQSAETQISGFVSALPGIEDQYAVEVLTTVPSSENGELPPETPTDPPSSEAPVDETVEQPSEPLQPDATK